MDWFSDLIYEGLADELLLGTHDKFWDAFVDGYKHNGLEELGFVVGSKLWGEFIHWGASIYDAASDIYHTAKDYWDAFQEFSNRKRDSGGGTAPQPETSDDPLYHRYDQWRDTEGTLWWASGAPRPTIIDEYFRERGNLPEFENYPREWGGYNAGWFHSPFPNDDIYIWGPQAPLNYHPAPPPSGIPNAGPPNSGGGANPSFPNFGFSSVSLQKKRKRRRRNPATVTLDQPVPGIDWAFWR